MSSKENYTRTLTRIGFELEIGIHEFFLTVVILRFMQQLISINKYINQKIKIFQIQIILILSF